MTALLAGSATDTGLVRPTNQDTLLLADPLYAVADGMGGHAAGEVASATAVRALVDAWRSAGAGDAAALEEAAKEANRCVWRAAQEDPDLHGMGTTLVAVALVAGPSGDELAVVNVGDSRVYRLRADELEQLTTDHSLVAELVAEGQIAAEDAEFHPQRHVLTRALGVDPEVPVDLVTIEAVAGDRLLLCSDGLVREVNDGQVASILRRLADPAEAAKELVNEARLRGGSDNITVVVVDVTDDHHTATRGDTDSTDATDAAATNGHATDAPITGHAITPGPADRDPDVDIDVGEHTSVVARVATADATSVIPVITSTPTPSTGPPAPPLRRLRQPIVTLRVVGFVVLVLVVLAGAAIGTDLYARGTYYVGVRNGDLTVFKGRPGGVLWFEPTVAETTGTPVSAVAAYERPSVTVGVLEPSVAAAKRYIARITTASPTTASPTTASPTSASPTTAPAGGST